MLVLRLGKTEKVILLRSNYLQFADMFFGWIMYRAFQSVKTTYLFTGTHLDIIAE